MGWLLISIVLPLTTPLIALFFYKLLPLPVAPALLSFLAPLKDGQLCWGAISFCVSGLYDIAVPPLPTGSVPASYAGYANGGLIFLLVAASLVAAGGAVFPTPMPRLAHESVIGHYRTMFASMVLTVLAGAAYAVLHWGLLMGMQIGAIS